MALFRKDKPKEKADIPKATLPEDVLCAICAKDMNEIPKADLKSINWTINNDSGKFAIGMSYPVCDECRKFIQSKEKILLGFMLDGLALCKEHIENSLRDMMKHWEEAELERQKLQAEIDAGNVNPEELIK